jgi:DNA-binding transcriptional regulator YiaG
MKKESKSLKKIPFDVHIPNLDGDGIAQTIHIEVTAFTDPDSGEDILTPESLELIEKIQARHMGLMSAGEIKELRHRLGLSQDEMSELLQIGGKSYTRWESGRARPSRSMNVVLCALRDSQLDVNYLQALRDPEKGTEWAARACRRYFSEMLAQFCETKPKHLHGFKSIESGQLAMWQHIWLAAQAGAKSTPPSKVVLFQAKHKSPQPMTEEEDTGPFAAQRLPSSRQQRETFMQARFDTKQIEETHIG